MLGCDGLRVYTTELRMDRRSVGDTDVENIIDIFKMTIVSSRPLQSGEGLDALTGDNSPNRGPKGDLSIRSITYYIWSQNYSEGISPFLYPV